MDFSGIRAFLSGKLVFILAVIVILNLISFVLYGADKLKAKRGKWRIPEAVLLWSAALGGGAGAFLGMRLFRHKTKHMIFIVVVTLSLVIQTLLTAGILILSV